MRSNNISLYVNTSCTATSVFYQTNRIMYLREMLNGIVDEH